MTGETAQAKRGISNPLFIALLILFVLVVDVFAFLIFPPFDKKRRASAASSRSATSTATGSWRRTPSGAWTARPRAPT